MPLRLQIIRVGELVGLDSRCRRAGHLSLPVGRFARRIGIFVLLFTVAAGLSVRAQIPPAAIQQFEHVIGNRVEAVTILGGDNGAGGGIYTFRGGAVADLSITKLGGGGNIGPIRPLGETGLKWAPVLLGNIGSISAANEFPNGYLQGNKSVYDVLAVQLGGGARFYFTDHLSLAPTLSGIYAHTKNEFQPLNAIGSAVKAAAQGTYVDWQIDTWSIDPAADAQYEWMWGRVTLTLGSRYSYFHTESFYSTSPVVNVYGDSQIWQNKIDVDIPIGLTVFGQEFHTGGFFARTELFGGAADGLGANHVYIVNGRFVVDLLGKAWAWKVKWLGIGASYFFNQQLEGWSAGVDVKFEF
jgi:hypothetical protein